MNEPTFSLSILQAIETWKFEVSMDCNIECFRYKLICHRTCIGYEHISTLLFATVENIEYWMNDFCGTPIFNNDNVLKLETFAKFETKYCSAWSAATTITSAHLRLHCYIKELHRRNAVVAKPSRFCTRCEGFAVLC